MARSVNLETSAFVAKRVALVVCVTFFCSADACGQELSLRPFRTFECSEKGALTLAADSTQRLIASGGFDAMVSVWDLAKNARIRQWQPSKSLVIDLAFAPDKPHVASASYPKVLTLFDLHENKQLWQTECVVAATRVTFSRDGTRIGTSSVVGKASIYDAASGRLIAAVGHTLPASGGVAFSADGRQLYVGAMQFKGRAGGAEVLRCDAETGAVIDKLGTHAGAIRRMRVSPSGRTLVSLDQDGGVKLWDLDRETLTQSWKLDVESTRCVEFLDETTLMVAGKEHLVTLRLGQREPVSIFDTGKGNNPMSVLPMRGLVASALGKTVHLYTFDKTLLTPAVEAKQADDPAMPKSKHAFGKLDNQPTGDARFDGLVSPEALSGLIGQPIVLKLKSGLLVFDANLESLQFDRRGHGLSFLKYKLSSGRSVTVKSADVYAMRIGLGRFHLRYYPPGNQLFLIDTKKASTVAANRLAATRRAPRTVLEEEAQREATIEHKKFLESAIKTLEKDGAFRIEETESTLLLTDLPESATRSLRTYVDALNESLNRVFDIPKGDSVWRGKAILAVFSSATKFGAFEERVMNNLNHGGRPGVRESNKRFLQTAIIREMNPNIARAICWGYSLGFANRLHSDARGVVWMKMGIAHMMQYAIIPAPRLQKQQREKLITQLKRHGSLLGLLRATKLEQDRWPLSGQLVEFLIARDAIAFGQLFRDTKLGVDLEDALQQNYGVTLDELAQAFGQSLGVANVGQ